MWYVYIVKCRDGSFYTGITTDVERRLKEHNETSKGAKYTKARRPVSLVFQEEAADKSVAAKREYQIKQMKRQAKEALIAGPSSCWVSSFNLLWPFLSWRFTSLKLVLKMSYFMGPNLKVAHSLI